MCSSGLEGGRCGGCDCNPQAGAKGWSEIGIYQCYSRWLAVQSTSYVCAGRARHSGSWEQEQARESGCSKMAADLRD